MKMKIFSRDFNKNKLRVSLLNNLKSNFHGLVYLSLTDLIDI